MTAKEDFRKALDNFNVRLLTIDRARGLLGRRISAILFDCRSQDIREVDEFVLGEIVTEFDLTHPQQSLSMEFIESPLAKNNMRPFLEITTKDGRRSFLKADAYTGGIFTGPDNDYEVWFKEI